MFLSRELIKTDENNFGSGPSQIESFILSISSPVWPNAFFKDAIS
jgi:hypothetical protein